MMMMIATLGLLLAAWLSGHDVGLCLADFP